jgi:hypothetical protein
MFIQTHVFLILAKIYACKESEIEFGRFKQKTFKISEKKEFSTFNINYYNTESDTEQMELN